MTALKSHKELHLPEHLGEAGEEEYAQLLTMVRYARGIFGLMIVRSDFPTEVRDALLNRLSRDLAPVPFYTVQCTRDLYDAPVRIAQTVKEFTTSAPEMVIALTGLEDTPGLVPVPGEVFKRPPALALLNHGREALRRYCPHPIVVWCNPSAYIALRENAPDFFDHYTGLFTFLDAAPVRAFDNTEDALSSELSKKGQGNSLPVQNVASEAVLAFYEEQITELTEPSIERARALLGLAEAIHAEVSDEIDELERRVSLSKKAIPDDIQQKIARAKAAVFEALGFLVERTSEWGRAHETLAYIIGLEAHFEPDKNWEVIEHLRKALSAFTEEEDLFKWENLQILLGSKIATLPTGNKLDHLQEAISCYETALRTITESSEPRIWAWVNSRRGNAYLEIPDGNQDQNIKQAIACYEAVLRVYTKADFPQQWAATQYNLGVAYSNLPNGDREQNRQQAIACYEAALRIYTETDFPQQWAATQYNLGNVYSDLCEVAEQNIQQAVACYQAALRIYTETDFPQQWAMTQWNLGLAYFDHTRLCYLNWGWRLDIKNSSARAQECFMMAERGYTSVGLDEKASEVAQFRHRFNQAK